jgi:hypothetical protein
VNSSRFKTDNPLLFGLSLLCGGGLVLMILVLGYGVVLGSAADNAPLGLLFWLGLALFLCGAIGWALVVRPFDHYDDINVPLDDGHGHGHEPHADDHALPATTEKSIEPVHH